MVQWFKVWLGTWLALQFIAWLAFLAGAAQITYTCDELDLDTRDVCSQFKSVWWAVWYQFLCSGIAAVLAVRSHLLRRFRLVAAMLYTALVSLLMESADSMNGVLFVLGKRPSAWSDTITAEQICLAGVIMLLVLDFLYIIMVTDGEGKLAPCFAGLPLGKRSTGAPSSTDLNITNLVSDGPLLPTNRTNRPREDLMTTTPIYAGLRADIRERDTPSSPTRAANKEAKGPSGSSGRYMSLPTK